MIAARPTNGPAPISPVSAAGSGRPSRRGGGIFAKSQPGALWPAASRLTPRASEGRSTAASAARARSPAVW